MAKLACKTHFCDILTCSVLRGCQEVEQAALADVIAVRERDPSCTAYSSALLYYKGYHALQTHRIAHGLWERGQRVLARSLQVYPLVRYLFCIHLSMYIRMYFCTCSDSCSCMLLNQIVGVQVAVHVFPVDTLYLVGA